MAKLPRVFQQLFGVNGDSAHFGQFGSRSAGFPVLSKDPNTIQALAAFIQNGWTDAINGANKAPFLEDMNGLFLLLFRQLGYLFQEGVPEYDAGTTYFTGSLVKKTGTAEVYASLSDNNTGQALPSAGGSNAFWQGILGVPIQTLQYKFNNQNTVITTDQPFAPTFLTGAITPKNALRRVRVDINTGVIMTDGTYTIAIYRNGVNVAAAGYHYPAVSSNQISFPWSYSFIDSPGIITPCTYQLYAAYHGISAGPFFVVGGSTQQDSTLILTEVL